MSCEAGSIVAAVGLSPPEEHMKAPQSTASAPRPPYVVALQAAPPPPSWCN